MIDLIRRRLSFKVSIILAMITIPPMIAAAYFITAREATNIEELTINSGKVAAMGGAQAYSTALEAAIDSGVMTISDVFDPVYEPIKGFDFGDNARFHTRYDFYTDRVVLGFQDKLADSSSDFLYAVGQDLNGYVPTHNTRYQHPITGDKTKDLSGNRTKRKYTGAVPEKVASNVEPVLVQRYARDNGQQAWDISSPIIVKGRHWGGFRVGVDFVSLTAHKRSLLTLLAVVFGALALVTIGFIFVMLWRSMIPLEHLSRIASEISTGEGLERPIKAATVDEIGQMAKSLNRLRASLQAAMSRLGE
jgi:HAMP domain-containing protein